MKNKMHKKRFTLLNIIALTFSLFSSWIYVASAAEDDFNLYEFTQIDPEVVVSAQAGIGDEVIETQSTRFTVFKSAEAARARCGGETIAIVSRQPRYSMGSCAIAPGSTPINRYYSPNLYDVYKQKAVWLNNRYRYTVADYTTKNIADEQCDLTRYQISQYSFYANKGGVIVGQKYQDFRVLSRCRIYYDSVKKQHYYSFRYEYKRKGSDDTLTTTYKAYWVNKPPVITITSPHNVTTFYPGDIITFRATATDPEDDDRSLLGRIDWSFSNGYRKRSHQFQYAFTSPGTYRVQAKVTDSDTSLATDTDTVTVEVKNHDIRIGSINGQLRSPHESRFPVALSISSATINGADSRSSVTWRSSINGNIGTGASINRVLSAGNHTITATLSRGGVTKTTTRRITIVDTIALGNIRATLQSPHESHVPVSLSVSDARINGGNASSRVQWRSNINGVIGTGGSIRPRLSPGVHQITATLSGFQNSKTVSTSITVVDSIMLGQITANLDSPHESYKPVPLSVSDARINGNNASNRVTWRSNINGNLGSGKNISPKLSPGTHQISATLSGYKNSKTVYKSVTIVPDRPYLTLASPMSGRVLDMKESINFTSQVLFRGEAVSQAPITWQSSLDGILGRGLDFTRRNLTEGVHQIDVSVTLNGQTDNKRFYITIYDQQKNLGNEAIGQCFGGNPINLLTGNKYHEEVDFSTRTESPLYLKRSYNSLSQSMTIFGYGWNSNVEERVEYDDETMQASVVNASGGVQRFDWVEGQWVDESSDEGELSRVDDGGWRYEVYDRTVKTYNAVGQIIESKPLNGLSLRYSYVDGRLERVVDAYDQALVFTYNDAGYVETLTDPDGFVYRYEYDAGNLIAVIYPDTTPDSSSDNSRKTYLYEDADYPHALTGLIDEEGIRFASWRYDDYGRADQSKHALDKEEYTITYNADTSVTTENALGKQTTYVYDSIKGVIKVTEVTGHQSANCAASFNRVEYDDENGFANVKTDWRGNQILLEHNDYGQVTSETVVDTGAGWTSAIDERVTVTTTYNDLRLPELITRPGATAETRYTDTGRLKTITVTDTTAQTQPYSTQGNTRVSEYRYTFYPDSPIVQSIALDGPRSDVEDITRYDYDAYGNLVYETNALGHTIRYQDYDSRGNPGTVIAANGVEISYVYNPRGWLISKTVHSSRGDVETRYSYYKNGLLKAETEPAGVVWRYVYNDARQLVSIENNEGEQKVFTPNDLTGDWETVQYRSDSGAVRYQMDRLFDEKGQVIGMQSPLGLDVRYTLDSSGNATHSTQIIKTGNTQETKSGRGYYDAFNRLRRSTSSDEAPVNYSYDAAGNLIQVQVEGGSDQITRYVYNGFNELIEEDSPATGRTVFYRDAAGNVTKEINSNDQEIQRVFDAIGRITTETYVGSESENIVYSYDEGANSIGLLTQVTDQSGETVWHYDDLGFIDFIDYVIAGVSYRIDYDVSISGLLNTVVYPTGQSVHYDYDSLARVDRVSISDADQGELALVEQVTYEPFGPIRRLNYGSGLGYDAQFDSSYRLSRLNHEGLSQVEQIDYRYDTANRLSQQRRSINNSLGVSSLWDIKQFNYDLANRVQGVQWSLQQGQQANNESITYGYDLIGNRTSKTVKSSLNNINEQLRYTVNDQSNRIESIQSLEGNGQSTNTHSYQYENTGQVSTDGHLSFKYNHRQRLNKAYQNDSLVGSYSYNAQGQRVKKTAGGKTYHFHYDLSGQLIAETNESGELIRQYVYLGNMPIAMLAGASLYDDVESTESMLIGATPVEITAAENQSANVLQTISGDASVSTILNDLSDNEGVEKLGLTLREAEQGETGARIDVYLTSSKLEDSFFVPIKAKNGNIVVVDLGGYKRTDPELVVDVVQANGDVVTERFSGSAGMEVKLERSGQLVQVYASNEEGALALLKEVTLPMYDDAYIGVVGENIRADIEVHFEVANDNLFYLHPDHLNAVYAVSSNGSKGIVWQRHDFDSGASPFGDHELSNGESLYQGLFEMPLRFPGQYYDQETKLNYNYFRDYDPATGRYVQSDPIGLDDGVNTYSYVANSPTGLIDPKGLSRTARRSGGQSFSESLTIVHAQNLIASIRQYNSQYNYSVARPMNSPRYIRRDVQNLQSVLNQYRHLSRNQCVSPNFIVAPRGTAFPVPAGASGPTPVFNSNGIQTGVAFTGGSGGANGQVSTMRLMNSTPSSGSSPGYPNGYIKYNNPSRQGVDPYTGRTIPNNRNHYPID